MAGTKFGHGREAGLDRRSPGQDQRRVGRRLGAVELVDVPRHGRHRPRRRPDVLRGRADQPALALLLEDVGRPAGHARAREHRREQLRRHLGVVEHDRRPELDVGGQHAVGLARLQLGERGLLERLGDLEARRADLAARCGAARGRAGPRRGRRGGRSPSAARRGRAAASRSPPGRRVRSTSSSICSTREGAPPCSGPDSAPTAPDSAAATSAPVEATTRAVKVEAFMPCSAAEIQ